MKVIRGRGKASIVFVGLGPGELLLESLTSAAKMAGIRNGAVVSGIGTLKRLRLHHITHCGFPPRERFVTINKPLELDSLSGIIADGEPHLHFTASWADKKVWAGHLETGSEVLYLAEVAMVGVVGPGLLRKHDGHRKIKLLEKARP